MLMHLYVSSSFLGSRVIGLVVSMYLKRSFIKCCLIKDTNISSNSNIIITAGFVSRGLVQKHNILSTFYDLTTMMMLMLLKTSRYTHERIHS